MLYNLKVINKKKNNLFKIKIQMIKTFSYCKINLTNKQKIIIFCNKKLTN